jgi:hypothetical protein
MKTIIIVGGIAALVYYFFVYNTTTLNPATIPPVAGSGLTNPVKQTGNAINLGPSFATKVPGVASVS